MGNEHSSGQDNNDAVTVFKLVVKKDPYVLLPVDSLVNLMVTPAEIKLCKAKTGNKVVLRSFTFTRDILSWGLTENGIFSLEVKADPRFTADPSVKFYFEGRSSQEIKNLDAKIKQNIHQLMKLRNQQQTASVSAPPPPPPPSAAAAPLPASLSAIPSFHAASSAPAQTFSSATASAKFKAHHADASAPPPYDESAHSAAPAPAPVPAPAPMSNVPRPSVFTPAPRQIVISRQAPAPSSLQPPPPSTPAPPNVGTIYGSPASAAPVVTPLAPATPSLMLTACPYCGSKMQTPVTPQPCQYQCYACKQLFLK